MKKILINTEFIKYYGPCKSRFENWLSHYKDWEGELHEFIDLENITTDDKIWLCKRCLYPEDIAKITVQLLMNYSDNYKKERPKDNATLEILYRLSLHIKRGKEIDKEFDLALDRVCASFTGQIGYSVFGPVGKHNDIYEKIDKDMLEIIKNIYQLERKE